MKWNGTEIFSHMAFTEQYIQIVITTNMRKHLAANHLHQIM